MDLSSATEGLPGSIPEKGSSESKSSASKSWFSGFFPNPETIFGAFETTVGSFTSGLITGAEAIIKAPVQLTIGITKFSANLFTKVVYGSNLDNSDSKKK